MTQSSLQRNKSVAFSGHRIIAEGITKDLREKLKSKIRLLYAMGINNYYCGMALGFDMLAAEAVLSLKTEMPEIRLVAVIPFRGQSVRWSYTEQVRYHTILSKCDEKIVLSQTYYNGCLLRRNDYMLAHSCGLVAYFDGKPQGGTFYTFRKARNRGMDIINLYKT